MVMDLSVELIHATVQLEQPLGDGTRTVGTGFLIASTAPDGSPRTVLVTSVERPDRPADTIEMLAVDDGGAWIVRTPLLPLKANGSGDVTAALFTAHYRATADAGTALARTVSSVFDLLQRTHASGQRELQLVESQEAYAHPRLQFEVTQVR